MGKSRTTHYCFFLIPTIIFLSLVGMEMSIKEYSYALAPPRPGELEELKERGVLESSIEIAKNLGNHKIDDHLLKRAISNLKRRQLQAKGMSYDQIDRISPLPAPPLGWSGMPTTGDIKIFVLLIDFNDYPHVNSQTDIHNKVFGNGNPSNYPYESLRNFYSRSSYGFLNLIEGATLGWYRHSGNRAEIEQNTTGRDNLIKQALNYFDSQGHDFSQYDYDNDGYIDYFVVLWSGPPGDWSGFWWPMLPTFYDQNYLVDGKKPNKYSWLWEDQYGDPLDIKYIIHETGHALGIPDYYDYDSSVGPDGGVGGLDIMHDYWWGDHNCFSKWLLEWINPTVVSDGVQMLTLNPSGTSLDAVIVLPGVDEDDIFSEFFIAQNRYRIGNDMAYPNDGLLIWHVDASLNFNKTNYLYDNSFTDHKLLRLMEADGLEEIEGNLRGNAGDYYTSGKILGPCTAPSSKRYDGGDSYVEISNIFMNGQQITAAFGANSGDVCGRGLVVNKLGNGTGGVASSGKICTNYPCSWKYGQEAFVTVTPVEDPGSSFGGWSGCDSVNGKQCYVTLNTDKTINLTFNYTSYFGRIAGRVTDGRNGIPNVSVRIYRADNSYAGYVLTNSEGNYITRDLAVTGDRTGNYKVIFNGEGVGHGSIYYNGKKSLSEADIIQVISPNITPNINATLTKLGPTISGCVRTKGGAGISGVIMGGLPNNPITDSTGCYSNLIPVFWGWGGTVTPVKSGYMFNPSWKIYANVTSNQVGQDYVGTELFQDLSPVYWAYDYILRIYNAGVTAGCSNEPLLYCPEEFVTREQMATFLIRAIESEPPANYCDSGLPFTDVTADMWSCRFIKKLKELGIAGGYPDGRYGPSDLVSREQMAVFLVMAGEGAPPLNYCDSGAPFTDVTAGMWSCRYIKRLAELGITTGYGDGRYGPYDAVTRAQMAVFLVRAFLD